MSVYTYTRVKKSPQHQGGKKMTKAEKKAIVSRTQDLIKQGVEKEIAEVMARTEFDCGLIRPVVNGNN